MQPKIQKTEELEATFNELVKIWYKESGYWSFSSQRAWHTAYMKIINLGKPVLPLIFRELETSGNSDWHHALEVITGANPVTEDIWGKCGAAKKAWLDWARKEGYRW